MAKKSKKRKKQQRRHHFVQQSGQTTPQSQLRTDDNDKKIAVDEPTTEMTNETTVESSASAKAAPKPEVNTTSPDTVIDKQLAERIKYMKRDSRLTAMIAGGIMVGLIILWILFDHTGLGPHVYKLIKIS